MITGTRAAYTVLWPGEEAIFILDEDGPVSVTNDAAAVVAELVAAHGDRPIFYRDTMRMWSELQHLAGVFTGFGCWNGRQGDPTGAPGRLR